MTSNSLEMICKSIAVSRFFSGQFVHPRFTAVCYHDDVAERLQNTKRTQAPLTLTPVSLVKEVHTMKKFNWSNFSSGFLNDILYSRRTPEEKRPAFKTEDPALLCPYMDDLAESPNRYFIEKYRDEIEFSLLKDDRRLLILAYNHLTGQKKEFAKVTSLELRHMFEELRRKRFSQSLLSAYGKVLLMVGAQLDDDEFFTRFSGPVSIDLRNANAPEVPLHKFQEDAVDALEKSFITDDNDAGLLVMPTGSGKTRVAAYFLLTKMIKEGYQIVWLTHRHLLIEQPAENLYTFSGLVKANNPAAKILRMLCVSGNHASIRQAEIKDDILILSVQSTVRSLDFLKRVLRSKVIIVVDEAHHSIAPSYRKIIDCIRKSKNRKTKLLGLTATPVRMNEHGTAELTNLFGNRIIYNVSAADLITQGILAEPVFEQISTDYEVTTTVDEMKYIRKYGEIDPSLVERIAMSGERNKVIIDRYLNYRERYGKTLIFALNINHCLTLHKDLISHGIRCDYVYSGRENNAGVIEQFRNNKLDVLININILTEGSDVPDIQTVFLTRPTASEVMLMQMVGRGLRGLGAHGTEKVYIVDFHDKWDVFVRWLTPVFVLGPEPEIPETTQGELTAKEIAYIPISVIIDIYNSISYGYAGLPTYSIIIPYGWFSAIDDEGNDVTVLVTESQLDGYLALERDKEKLLSNIAITGVDMQKYFTGFTLPPPADQLQMYLDDLRLDEIPPIIYPLDARKDFDPFYIAQRIKNENLSFNQMQELMENAHAANRLAQDMFPDVDAYKQRVMACLVNKEQPIGAKVDELPIEKIPYDLTPYHDLNRLYQEVNEEMFGKSIDTSKITWTDRRYKSYYGQYCYTNGEIRINKLLDSKDVPEDVIKYLIYHELLHRDYHNHDKAFREREHLYPNHTEWDSFLDGQMHKFDLGDVFEW